MHQPSEILILMKDIGLRRHRLATSGGHGFATREYGMGADNIGCRPKSEMSVTQTLRYAYTNIKSHPYNGMICLVSSACG